MGSTLGLYMALRKLSMLENMEREEINSDLIDSTHNANSAFPAISVNPEEPN